MSKEAKARIKISKLLEETGWRFFDNEEGNANIVLENKAKLTQTELDKFGEDFEKTSNGFIDYLLLDNRGFPFIVLEAKKEDINPLFAKEQARKYAQSQNCRFIILSNGNLHYFWDLQRGNPNIISKFPRPETVIGYTDFKPNAETLINETVNEDYIVKTQKPDYEKDPRYIDEAQRPAFIEENKLRFLRKYQVRAIERIQEEVKEGRDRFLFEMATGTGKTLTSAAVIKLFLRTGNARRVLFLVDRLELEDQADKAFREYLKTDYKCSIYKENRDDWRQAEIVVSTVQSFLFKNKYKRIFQPTDFDLVISDEAHRSQVNLDQKVKVTEKGVTKTYGFAKYLHDSLPNATFVGFTGTPIDATLDVFGKVVDAYTMTESVKDEITVRIVCEGRAAKVLLNNSKLKEIEEYYAKCAEIGSNKNQIEQSKKEMAQMYAIIGDPDRLKEVASDFVHHYENRISEGATVKGKAMFVCSTREIAYELYKNILELRPEWNEIRAAEEGAILTDKDKRELKPIERIKLIATRGQDDPKEMYVLLGTKEQRKELDRQFKNEKSNFKIAIVVDMWLTGFDVPFLDSIYIDKPIQRHNLIQTISRVNRKFEGKNKGLVVDYIGIKNQMNLALKQYSEGDKDNFEDIAESIIIVRNHLDLLAKLFHTFDSSKYFKGSTIQQLNTLNLAAEFTQQTKELETRFMGLVKRLKAAYDICAGSEQLTQNERDYTHFYLAVRSIVFKLTKGNAPDTAQMNAKVREKIKEALLS